MSAKGVEKEYTKECVSGIKQRKYKMKTIELTDEEVLLIKQWGNRNVTECLIKQRYPEYFEEDKDIVKKTLELSKSILEKL
ncbi:MAG: hypothetical protein J1E16_04250 [Muribaculaceae bacterium]|nr:hypothetical protein [Muribaculaceae bacterium]